MSKATTTPLSLAAIVILVVASVFAQNPAHRRSGGSIRRSKLRSSHRADP